MNKEVKVLFLIIFLALLVRVPGVFWGYHLFDDKNYSLHADEHRTYKIAHFFLEDDYGDIVSDKKSYYMHGFGFLVFLFYKPIEFLISQFVQLTAVQEAAYIIGVGRLVSVLFGLLTVVLVYFLTKRIFDRKSALLASLFLALSPLHVMHSHFAMEAIASVFFFYLSLYFWLLYWDKQDILFFLLAASSAGVAFGIKFIFMSALPAVYFIFKKDTIKEKVFLLLLLISGFVAGFYLVNGASYTLTDFQTYQKEIELWTTNDSLIMNYLFGIFGSLIAVSLPVFLLAIASLKRSKWETALVLLTITILAQFLFINSVRFRFRDLLFVAPLLAIFAGNGLTKIKKMKKFVFFLTLMYLIVAIFSTEYYYIFDTRQDAGAWLRENVGGKELIGVSWYAVVPPEYKTEAFTEGNARYVIMHESYYRRFIRNFSTPFEEPSLNTTIPNRPITDAKFIHNLFDTGSPYKLVKKIEVKPATIEAKILKGLGVGYYLDSVGDILIYEKI